MYIYEGMHRGFLGLTYKVAGGVGKPLGVDHAVGAQAVVIPGLMGMQEVPNEVKRRMCFRWTHTSEPKRPFLASHAQHAHLHDRRGDTGHGGLPGGRVARPVVLGLGALRCLVERRGTVCRSVEIPPSTEARMYINAFPCFLPPLS